MLPVRFDVAGVIDQVDRRGAQAEHHERHRDLDQYLGVVVADRPAQRGQRRGQHQDVFHPLARAYRLDHADDQVPRGFGHHVFTHFGHTSIATSY
jgi:hypothetical protein